MKEFILSDGRRMAYREKGLSGSAPTLVMVHGWSMSSAVFTEAIDYFSAHYRVLVPELRGHGGSEPGDGYGLKDLASDLKEWILSLDLRGLYSLGWSLGGQTLLELYPSVSERIEKLILVSSTPRFSVGEGWEEGLPGVQVKALSRDLKRNFNRTLGYFFDLQFSEENLDSERYREIIEFAVRKGSLPDPDAAAAGLETLRCSDQRECLASIDCPTLVIHGEMDAIVPAGAGRFIAQSIPGAQFKLVSQVGHAPFLSKPTEIFGYCQEFLR